jgi:hypothetical protein
MLQISKSLPRVKTKKYYKCYKSNNNYIDAFYNKDLVIIEESRKIVLAYESTIVLCRGEGVTNKIIRDFTIVHGIKPHNINKEWAIQHRINSIVDSLETLIKENIEKYDSFVYTQKPFLVCFIKLCDYNRPKESFITYCELSLETMKWVPTGTNKLDFSCGDCEIIIPVYVLLDRYYAVECYTYAEDDEYVVEDDEYDYELPRDYFTFIYDLLTGDVAYSSVSYTIENDEDAPPLHIR